MLNKFIYTSLRVTSIKKFFLSLYERYKRRRIDYVNAQFLLNFKQCESTWSNLLFACRLLKESDFERYTVKQGYQIHLITPYRNVVEFFEHLDIMVAAAQHEAYSAIRYRELYPHTKSLTEFLTDDNLVIVNIYKTKERLSQKIIKLNNVLDALTDQSMIIYQNRNLTNILHAARAVLEALLEARALNEHPSQQKTGEKD